MNFTHFFLLFKIFCWFTCFQVYIFSLKNMDFHIISIGLQVYRFTVILMKYQLYNILLLYKFAGLQLFQKNIICMIFHYCFTCLQVYHSLQFLIGLQFYRFTAFMFSYVKGFISYWITGSVSKSTFIFYLGYLKILVVNIEHIK